jgi:hypothetical protein
MGQNNYAVYMLVGEPNVFVYTSTKCQNTLALMKDLGFELQYTVYSYGWSVEGGHIYSLTKYLNMEDKDRMLKLVKINNGTDTKIKEIYKGVCDAEGKDRKRWWQYYGVKKV